MITQYKLGADGEFHVSGTRPSDPPYAPFLSEENAAIVEQDICAAFPAAYGVHRNGDVFVVILMHAGFKSKNNGMTPVSVKAVSFSDRKSFDAREAVISAAVAECERVRRLNLEWGEWRAAA